MADSGIFMGWARPATGQGEHAMALYRRMNAYFTALHAAGRIASFETVMLGPYGGDLGGFVLVRGERGRLNELRDSDEFRELTIRGSVALEGFRVIRAHMGEEVRQLLAGYQRLAGGA